MFAYMCVRDQKRVWDPLELKLKLGATMYMLGTEPGSSKKNSKCT